MRFLCDFLKSGKPGRQLFVAIFIVRGLSGCSFQSSCDSLDRLSNQAETLRGLEFKQPVECRIEAGSIVDKLNVAAQHKSGEPVSGTEKELSCQERLQNLLFFAPSDVTRRPNSELDASQVRGAYSFRNKTLFLSPGLPRHILEQTVVHELTHALDDQHFDLQSILQSPAIAPLAANSDYLLARSALVEGDAVLSENLLRRSSSEICGDEHLNALVAGIHGAENPRMREQPSLGAFRRQFANSFGLAFVCRSAASRDRLFQAPPTSTREIVFGVPAETIPLPQFGDDIRCSDHPGLASLIYLVGVENSELIAAYRGDSAVLVGKAGERVGVVWRIRLSGSPELIASSAETIRSRFQALKLSAHKSVAEFFVFLSANEITVRIQSND